MDEKKRVRTSKSMKRGEGRRKKCKDKNIKEGRKKETQKGIIINRKGRN